MRSASALRARGTLVALALLAWPLSASADEQDKRQIPDYDGRTEPTTAGDVLLWVPRILLSPLYLVSEFVLRRPLGFLISAAEREQVPKFLLDVFTFGTEGQAGLTPVAFLDFGFEPSIGLYFFWNDVLAEGHDLRVRAAFWSNDWLSASALSRHHFGNGASVALRGSITRRPDYVFHGIGPRTLQSDEGRYGALTEELELELDVPFWRSSRVRTQLGVRHRRFRDGNYHGEPTLNERVEAGVYPTPAGYEDGYDVLYNRMLLAIDSRRPHPSSGTGVRLELRAEQMSPLEGDADGFIRYGGIAGVFYDLSDSGRVLGLAAGAEFADSFTGAEIPFTELAAVGGSEFMRGFVSGRLYGRSATAIVLVYRWPVWVWLSGSIQLSLGNVFGPQLEDFDPDLLRFTGTIGIESNDSRDSALELLLGVGTETIAQGAAVTSVRIIFGTHYGF